MFFTNFKMTYFSKKIFLRKVRKKAKITNRYNQAPHLTQHTNGKITTPQPDTTNESQEASPFRTLFNRY